MHFHLNDVGFAYDNANVDVDDDCSDDVDASNASDAAAYAATNDANADAKIPNDDAHHVAGAYVVLLLPSLLPMFMLLRQLL